MYGPYDPSGFMELVGALNDNKRLTSLSLPENVLTNSGTEMSGIEQLASVLRNNQKLSYLDLRSNSISSQGPAGETALRNAVRGKELKLDL